MKVWMCVYIFNSAKTSEIVYRKEAAARLRSGLATNSHWDERTPPQQSERETRREYFWRVQSEIINASDHNDLIPKIGSHCKAISQIATRVTACRVTSRRERKMCNGAFPVAIFPALSGRRFSARRTTRYRSYILMNGLKCVNTHTHTDEYLQYIDAFIL